MTQAKVFLSFGDRVAMRASYGTSDAIFGVLDQRVSPAFAGESSLK